MREFQDKKRVKRLLYSKGSIVALVILILLFANATTKVYKKEKESSLNAAAAGNQLVKLENRQKLLDSEISRLNTDDGIEEEIRSKYSVTKNGENMLIIMNNNAATGTAPVEMPQGWWDSFKGWFQ